MTPSNRQIGSRGEEIVRFHLERLGWHIRAMNYRCPQGEIDIIAEEPTPTGAVWVFVEVKARRGKQHGTPQEAVTARKRQTIVRVAQHYLGSVESEGEEPACRFDVAEVWFLPDGAAKVQLRCGAFQVGE